MKLSELKEMCADYIANPKSPCDDAFKSFARYESIIIARKLKAVIESLEASVDYRVYDEPVMLISGLKTLLESNDKGDE